ncbi:armadillo-type protein [Schizophyllum commune]
MSSAVPLALEGKGVPLWLDSAEGAPSWTLIITPKESAQKSLDPPWTFRVRDPQGDVRDLGVRKEPDSCDDAILEATQIFLDDLSASNFDRMSDRIIAWTNKWSMRDGRMLVSITELVYRKATDNTASCVLCARLCRKMMEKISSNVRDEDTRDAEGKLVTGGQLFRKHLVNSCQEDFERYCSSVDAQKTNTCDTPAASWTGLEDGVDNELESPGGAHGLTQVTERRGLGTILFIGELFKVQMLTERIMHQCVQKLLGNVDNPAEEEIESLCKLLTIVGELLDTPRAHAHMDVYFARLKELTKKPTLSSRMQFMLQVGSSSSHFRNAYAYSGFRTSSNFGRKTGVRVRRLLGRPPLHRFMRP